MTHPTIRHLIDHAAGALTSGMGLAVGTHLALCPDCLGKTARLEILGGAFLAEESLPRMAGPDLDATLASIAEEAPEHPEPPLTAALPSLVRQALEDSGANLPWRRLLPGLWDIRLPGDPGEDVRLLRARPGTRIFGHKHAGEEATLVLRGQIRDGERVFGRGALSLCGQEHDHSPEAVGKEECVCLLVLEGPMRFTGRLGPLLNLLPQ